MPILLTKRLIPPHFFKEHQPYLSIHGNLKIGSGEPVDNKFNILKFNGTLDI